MDKKIKKPKMLPDVEMDLAQLKEMCQGYIDYCESKDRHEDNDFKTYIYEAALQSLFGKDVFDFINQQFP